MWYEYSPLLYWANMVVWPHLLPLTNTCKHDFLGIFDPLGNLMWKNDTRDTFAILCKYGSLTTFATLNKYMQTWVFLLHLIPWAIMWKNDTRDTFAILCKYGSLTTFATLNKYMQTWFFDYIWSPGQLCEKMILEIHLLYCANMVVWPHLLPWTNTCKHELHLIPWAIMWKNDTIHLLYCANMVVWPHLLPWTNTCKHDFLITFDPLGNYVKKWY